MKKGLLPAVVARLTFDNTTRHNNENGDVRVESRPSGCADSHEDLGVGRLGFAFRREAGGAAELLDFTSKEKGTKAPTEPFVFMRWSPSDGVRERYNPVHLLGSCPGFGFEVPAGKKYGMVIALGSFLEGFQTNGLDGRYLYTNYYKGLADVLRQLSTAPATWWRGLKHSTETRCRESL